MTQKTIMAVVALAAERERTLSANTRRRYLIDRSWRAKRAAGTLDLGTVTCAGAASVTLADGCTASLAAATGTDDFTVSGDTLTITSPTAFTEATTLHLNDGAKLNLAFAGTLKVRRIYVDGVRQHSGNYTTGDADWIADGTGRVEMGKGLIMGVR